MINRFIEGFGVIWCIHTLHEDRIMCILVSLCILLQFLDHDQVCWVIHVNRLSTSCVCHSDFTFFVLLSVHNIMYSLHSVYISLCPFHHPCVPLIHSYVSSLFITMLRSLVVCTICPSWQKKGLSLTGSVKYFLG